VTRPRADLPSREDIAKLIDSEGRLPVRVTPGARVEAVALGESALQVKTRAKPQDGAANRAVIRLVARSLGIAPSQVELLRGATSRDKLFRVKR